MNCLLMKLDQLSQKKTRTIKSSPLWIEIVAESRIVDAMNDGLYDKLPV